MTNGPLTRMDMVILLPKTADLPEPVRALSWRCSGSVYVVNDPVEAVVELAGCRPPRTLLIVEEPAWGNLESMRAAVDRHWPDAHVELIGQGSAADEPSVRTMNERCASTPARTGRRRSAAAAMISRPIETLPRHGRRLVNVLAIGLLLLTPIVWALVLMRVGG